MQEGWECIKCHNVYAPNIPFCLYCWFQVNNSPNTEMSTTTPAPVVQSPPQIEIPKLEIIPDQEIHNNKNLSIAQIDHDIPVLNKEATCPLPNKFPDTKIFLSGIGHAKERAIGRDFKIPYVLDSIMDFPTRPSKLVKQYFDYIKENDIEYLFDSGAFTYMSNPKKSINLDEYIQRYCFYINEFDIKNFFELDLDVFLSIEEVENIRRKIYLETHKQPIVVFHTERGKNYWTKMCKENEFVAVGGLVVGNNWNSADGQKELCDMCDEAHMYGTYVHGLGFTPLTLLNSHTMFFDTVDSTSWNFSKRGYAAKINEKGEIIKVDLPFSYTTTESQENDLRTWAQFCQDYRGGPRP